MSDLPLERYGLIAELAHRMRERNFDFGKTALQKQLFFLKELYGVDAGYEFSLYTYGPFDSTLLSDLDSVSSLDGVDVEYHGNSGYRIFPGRDNEDIRRHAEDIVAKYSEKIDAVIDEFGNMWARSLELFSTIVFVERDARSSGGDPTIDQIAAVVHELKPHFSDDEIRSAIKDLAERKHIAPAVDAKPRPKRAAAR